MKLTVSIILSIIAFTNAFTVSTTGFDIRNRSNLQMTVLTYGGKKADFEPGSPLKNACAKLGVKPKYSCKK